MTEAWICEESARKRRVAQLYDTDIDLLQKEVDAKLELIEHMRGKAAKLRDEADELEKGGAG